MSELTEDTFFEFDNVFEAEAYAKWFLRLPLDAVNEELDEEETRKFFARRALKLNSEADDLARINFKSPQICDFDRKKLYKIAKKAFTKPLSSKGSYIKSSRFNYKNISSLQNRTIYFGQDKECCYGELFHLDIQKYNYTNLIGRDPSQVADEFKFPEYIVYEYEVSADKILVLTTDSTYQALGIPDRVLKNEWFSLNDEFEIPSASQLLGSIVKKKGFSGILFTSVRTQTTSNLVLFEENTGELEFNQLSQTPLDASQFK